MPTEDGIDPAEGGGVADVNRPSAIGTGVTGMTRGVAGIAGTCGASGARVLLRAAGAGAAATGSLRTNR